MIATKEKENGMNYTDALLETILGGDTVSALSKNSGAKQSQVESVIGAALPLMLEGMQNNASTKHGEQALTQALSDHAGNDASDVKSFLAGVDSKDSAKILQHLFGDNANKAVSALSKKAGVEKGQTMSILLQLAPLLLSLLGQQNQGNSGGIGSILGSLLGGSGSGSGSIIGSLLGSGTSDAAGSLLGNILGGGNNSNSSLGGELLGSLLGGNNSSGNSGVGSLLGSLLSDSNDNDNDNDGGDLLGSLLGGGNNNSGSSLGGELLGSLLGGGGNSNASSIGGALLGSLFGDDSQKSTKSSGKKSSSSGKKSGSSAKKGTAKKTTKKKS